MVKKTGKWQENNGEAWSEEREREGHKEREIRGAAWSEDTEKQRKKPRVKQQQQHDLKRDTRKVSKVQHWQRGGGERDRESDPHHLQKES